MKNSTPSLLTGSRYYSSVRKEFLWERGGGQSTNFIKVHREEAQILLTTGLHQALWVCTRLDQYFQKILALELVH